jgi:hypothetical protein
MTNEEYELKLSEILANADCKTIEDYFWKYKAWPIVDTEIFDILEHNKSILLELGEPSKRDACYFCENQVNGCQTFYKKEKEYIVCFQCSALTKKKYTKDGIVKEFGLGLMRFV